MSEEQRKALFDEAFRLMNRVIFLLEDARVAHENFVSTRG